MTNEEKQDQMHARNAAIIAYYNEGHKLKECASKFGLGRQRILQILQSAGAWRPYEKGGRTKFLGVNISAETKAALPVIAASRGVSVSRLASDVLDEVVAEQQEGK